MITPNINDVKVSSCHGHPCCRIHDGIFQTPSAIFCSTVSHSDLIITYGKQGNSEKNGGGGDGPDVSDNGGDSGGGIPEGDTDVEEEGPVSFEKLEIRCCSG